MGNRRRFFLPTLAALAATAAAAAMAGEPFAEPPVGSALRFSSSNERLEQAFAWAKVQALAYAHDGNDPVGAWYEAALPARNAFCMRDVSHQVNGAAALGLDKANFNMLRRFASAVAPERDWAGYWEIDVTGRPAPVDYISDQDFWYNLPANFDVLDAIIRMGSWTGDDTYLTDPDFARFFQSTAKEYVAAWDLQPERILSRPRIMNRRLTSGRDIDHRGIPSYTEGRDDFNLGVDLLAAEYRAFIDLAFLAERDRNPTLQHAYLQTANALSQLIEKHAWSPHERHYHGSLSSNGAGQGTGDMFVLHFRAANSPERVRGALAYLKSAQHLNRVNIEEESYLPKIFFLHGEKAAAYERILSLSSPAKPRREYPEVSFAIIDAIATGLMGIDVEPAIGHSPATIRTVSRLLQDTEHAAILGVHIQGATIDVTHTGHHQSTVRNHSTRTLRWEAAFPGAFSELAVDGKPTRATVRNATDPVPTSSVMVDLAPGTEATISTSTSRRKQ